ncbi:hypothetical protein CC1G_03350 [Coprinopsis cinerea okayama7|uniref:T6SS Phospholipase effector Tle1-like catalytic domain-containing protein n=1 Tax=Coprinopsis cinerea (strain Okayama-7 / 130 / ATCC MYA-4618 / FGSC 9003) TaxID=240176 RepID=A8NQX4_COPC7|nr:hypothetical protein CC1G_03350 [Coprinopsis cinerea okayama7\|eukprot:XP_001835568.2 hypothetical protein CC1G_03350 [Coprinopsis cinerea okayama7\
MSRECRPVSNDSGKPRTLVLCFDGTSDQYDADNSNVVKFFELLSKDPNHQLCYYDPGIGTWFHPGVVSPLFDWFAKLMDQAVAWYLDAHVMDGYKFLMQNYRHGDKICLFGFSRGAYTARALGGFLHKIGLLSRDNFSQVPFAYDLYKRRDKESVELAFGFKRTFCQSVRVEFMGVWDTVASVGVIMGKTLPFTNSNSSITTFRHALALDERRAKYRPNVYHRPSPTLMAAALDPQGASAPLRSDTTSSSSSSSSGRKGKRSSVLRRVFSVKSEKEKDAEAAEQHRMMSIDEGGLPDDVLEVWFVGGHSDVGGGNTLNTSTHSVANIPLRWMVREVMKSSCGIRFSEEALSRLSLDMTEVYDGIDALEPIHDRLTGSFKNRLWWLLEIIPLTYSWQDKEGVWHRTWSAPSSIPSSFHLEFRMKASNLGYKPKARWEEGTEEYVS